MRVGLRLIGVSLCTMECSERDRILVFMSDVTQILSQIEHGDPSAAGQLLPHVDEELRRLAASKLARERPGQTRQVKALVNEAYQRLLR